MEIGHDPYDPIIPDPLRQEDRRRWPCEAAMFFAHLFTRPLNSTATAVTLLTIAQVTTLSGCQQLSSRRSPSANGPTPLSVPAMQPANIPEFRPSGGPSGAPPMPPAETDLPPLPGASAQWPPPHRIGGFTAPARYDDAPRLPEPAEVDGPALTVPPLLDIQRTAGVSEGEVTVPEAEAMVEPLKEKALELPAPSVAERLEGLTNPSFSDDPFSQPVQELAEEGKVPLPTEVESDHSSGAIVELDRHLFLLDLSQEDELREPSPLTRAPRFPDLPKVSHRPASAPKMAGELDSWMSSGLPYDMVITPGPMANRWSNPPATPIAQPDAGMPRRLAVGGMNWELRPIE